MRARYIYEQQLGVHTIRAELEVEDENFDCFLTGWREIYNQVLDLKKVAKIEKAEGESCEGNT